MRFKSNIGFLIKLLEIIFKNLKIDAIQNHYGFQNKPSSLLPSLEFILLLLGFSPKPETFFFCRLVIKLKTKSIMIAPMIRKGRPEKLFEFWVEEGVLNNWLTFERKIVNKIRKKWQKIAKKSYKND